MAKDNGGPAFPLASEEAHFSGYDGMTLRDYFAGQALTGIIAGYKGGNVSDVPLVAYQVADAMIAERSK